MRHQYTISCEGVEGGAYRPPHAGLLAVLLCAGLLLFQGGSLHADGVSAKTPLVVAQGTQDQQNGSNEKSADEEKLSPEEKMRRRFPQSVRVGDLIGLPMLDWDDLTIGRVRHVVRTPAGKVQLIVTYGGWFGWGQRLVPVPIEVVGILARQLAALDMPRSEFDKTPTWSDLQTVHIPPDEMIRIAVTRR